MCRVCVAGACLLCADGESNVQDCLKALAIEGQSVAGFVEDVIFQCFRVDPKSLDAKERWVRMAPPPAWQ